MRKSSPGCAVMISAKFVKIVTGASGNGGTIGVATEDGLMTLFIVSFKAPAGMVEPAGIAGVGNGVSVNE